MDSKPLLYGLIGFFMGGLLVSVAATTFDRPVATDNGELSMSEMTDSLRNKTGDEYDEAFIAHMIDHHESAVEMAALSAGNAKHDEIKQLSNDIIKNQAAEIEQMKQWQMEWGYGGSDNTADDSKEHDSH